MKTSLSHLPETKQEQISRIVQVIMEIVIPEKIILYGSYARGTYQEDTHVKDGTLYEYLSDYDILLILRDKQLPEYEIQDRIVNKVNFKAPLNVLICYLDHVNEGLEKGQYFFTEIIESGVLLFDAGTEPFTIAKKLSPTERKEIAQEDFDFWFNNGNQFLLSAKFLLEESIKKNGKPNIVAHQLHQAVESFYGAVLLVFTGYKPKIHNIDKYRAQIKDLSEELVKIFPFPTKDRLELELFNLLKRAYIGGKFKKDFEISFIEVNQLITRIEKLRDVVEKICSGKIASFH